MINNSFFTLVFLLKNVILSEAFEKLATNNIINDSGNESRIFGGNPASDGLFPYMVFVLYSHTGSCPKCSYCSGSLLALDKVVSAAHCFDSSAEPVPENTLVTAGNASLQHYVKWRLSSSFSIPVDESAFGVQERRASLIFIPYDYDSKTFEHDIAIIFLKNDFELSRNVRPIALSKEPVEEATTCTILGWGQTQNDSAAYQLTYSSTAVVLPYHQCRYTKNPLLNCLQSSTSGFCHGDSGSPLVCDGLVRGVASHLVIPKPNTPCGAALEQFYADTYSDLAFIIYVGGAPQNSISLVIFTALSILFPFFRLARLELS